MCIRVTPLACNKWIHVRSGRKLSWQTRPPCCTRPFSPRNSLVLSLFNGFPETCFFDGLHATGECGRELWIRQRDRMQVRVCSPLSPASGHWFAVMFIPSTSYIRFKALDFPTLAIWFSEFFLIISLRGIWAHCIKMHQFDSGFRVEFIIHCGAEKKE